MMYQILEFHFQQEHRLFRSPISKNARNILDLGTGEGKWCVDVADSLPGGEFFISAKRLDCAWAAIHPCMGEGGRARHGH